MNGREKMMKKFFVVIPALTALLLPIVASAEDSGNDGSDEDSERSERREWVYIGVHAGGQYLDFDALTGGEAFDQLVSDAYSDATTSGTIDPDTPQPRHYSAENGFAWGLYGGLTLGRHFRIGVRFTHSMMEVHGEGLSSGESVTFNIDLITTLIELQLRIPLFRDILVPFAGIGLGYAFLGGDTQIISSRTADSDLGVSCFDGMGEVGLDINLGRYFSIGGVAHFSFIGFYYDGAGDAASAEATWGFATDYLARLTVRI
jgi:hypothetical protein